MGTVDSRAFSFVAADEASGLTRFCCHETTPIGVTVTGIEFTPQGMAPFPKGDGLAELDLPDACRYTEQGAKDMPKARRAPDLLGSTDST